MGRPRSFDHDAARKMYATGRFSLSEVARRFGVSRPSIHSAVDPSYRDRKRVADRARLEELYHRPCIKECGRMAWHMKGNSGMCTTCSALEQVTTVRDTTLRCGECGEWKPDDAFPRHNKAGARRGRHSVCSVCATPVRQAYRERLKVPCDRCGKPRLPKSEKRPDARDTGLCLECYRDDLRQKTSFGAAA